MRDRRGPFRRRRLEPGQWRWVAESRYGDAKCLLDSGDPARANGAIYMAGFVIECLLKALLIERHPNLHRVADQGQLSKSDREIAGLLSSHDLVRMIGFLPEIAAKLDGVRTAAGRSAWRVFMGICAEWTVHARYAPKSAGMDRAGEYLDGVKEVKKWLGNL